MTIWNKLGRFPPVLVRLLAKDGRRALSDREIVAASGGRLTIADVKRLSLLGSWDDVSVRHLRAFLVACNVDLTERVRWRNSNRYIKGAKFDHLRRHEDWPQFREILAAYAETLRS